MQKAATVVCDNPKAVLSLRAVVGAGIVVRRARKRQCLALFDVGVLLMIRRRIESDAFSLDLRLKPLKNLDRRKEDVWIFLHSALNFFPS
jgi:hypothetical protein